MWPYLNYDGNLISFWICNRGSTAASYSTIDKVMEKTNFDDGDICFLDAVTCWEHVYLFYIIKFSYFDTPMKKPNSFIIINANNMTYLWYWLGWLLVMHEDEFPIRGMSWTSRRLLQKQDNVSWISQSAQHWGYIAYLFFSFYLTVTIRTLQ